MTLSEENTSLKVRRQFRQMQRQVWIHNRGVGEAEGVQRQRCRAMQAKKGNLLKGFLIMSRGKK